MFFWETLDANIHLKAILALGINQNISADQAHPQHGNIIPWQ